LLSVGTGMQGSHEESVTLLSVGGVFGLHVKCVPVNVDRHVFECYSLLLKEVNFCVLIMFYQAFVESFDGGVNNLNYYEMVVTAAANAAAEAAVLSAEISKGDCESDCESGCETITCSIMVQHMCKHC
jgi:hypothetical protein